MMEYINAFWVGGLICALAQILLDRTKLMPGRIMVLLVCTGAVLSFLGLYQPLFEYAGAGASVPLIGFGHLLFHGVKEAVVLLTPGEDHTYVLDSSNKVDASASVTLTMEDGKTLTDDQAQAIRNLVSRGLAGLNVENVDISDTYGNS